MPQYLDRDVSSAERVFPFQTVYHGSKSHVRITIGEHVQLDDIIITSGHKERIPVLVIGDRTVVGFKTSIIIGKSVIIGKDCMISTGCMIAETMTVIP